MTESGSQSGLENKLMNPCGSQAKRDGPQKRNQPYQMAKVPFLGEKEQLLFHF